MFRSLRAWRKAAKDCLSKREIERDGEGVPVVHMTVLDDSDFLSPLSYHRAEVLSSEVSSFLEKRVNAMPPQKRVAVHIHSDCIDEQEQVRYRAAVATTFRDAYDELAQESRRSVISAVVMLLFGVLLLGVMWALSAGNRSEILIEVVDIFAWVFVWEAVDTFFLTRTVQLQQKKRCLSLIYAKICFFPLEKKEKAEET